MLCVLIIILAYLRGELAFEDASKHLAIARLSLEYLRARWGNKLREALVVIEDVSNIVGLRLNERMRFLRYDPSMYFEKHVDGSYVTPDGGETSWLTIHLYLNGSPTNTDELSQAGQDTEPLQGGATRFFSTYDWSKFLDVQPQTGACLVFQHRGLLHSGEKVVSGTKYTMRTDIMYRTVRDE